MKRKKRRWPIVVIVLAACVIPVAVMMIQGGLRFLPGQGDEASMTSAIPVESVTGDIVSSVVATGNLEGSVTDVTMPYELEVDELLVSNDEDVVKGDAVATVDSNSLSNRISEVKDELNDVNDAVEDLVNGDTDTVYVRSKATARVKKIYVDEGDKVKDAKTTDGALRLLSLDGLMSVDINSETKLSRGDEVTVVLADGSETDGTVESAKDGKYTVTLTDNGPEYGEAVSVKHKDAVVGEGTLDIHEPLRVTCDSGKVSSVSVKENDKVYNGTSLLKIKKSSVNARFASLDARRDALVTLLERLTALSVDRTVYSPVSGVVDSVVTEEGRTVTTTDSALTASEGAILTIAGQDNMTLSVDIDELDIAAITPGLETDVEVDALEGETFHGSVTEVSDEADVDTGVARYSAVIELERSDAMKVGMSATATITKERRDGVVTIPLDAVQEFGDRVFVFTGVDGELGVPVNEKEIETGLSDGTNVEVVSGLNAGDVIYYVPVVSGDEGMQMRSPAMMGVGGISGGGPVRVNVGPGGDASFSRPGGGSGGGTGRGRAPAGGDASADE
jgi:multidrug efflux pump subunit AcrA (membrane-fusion protein)